MTDIGAAGGRAEKPARVPWAGVPLVSYADALPLVRRRVVLEAQAPLNLPRFRGALWHSVLGRALKVLSCTEPPGVCHGCWRRETCAYPRLVEPEAPDADGGVIPQGRRVPGPLLLDAGPWEGARLAAGDAFGLDFAVVDRDGDLAAAVEGAVARASADGLGHGRVRARLRATLPRAALASELARSAELATGRIRLRLVSPLRLRRRGAVLRRFDLRALARDLSFRLAALGHYHGRLPWPAPWAEALAEAERAVVREARTRWVEAVRYSASQRREIVVGGLVGEVWIEGAGEALRQLLAVGTVIHAGKGTSLGLGELAIAPLEGEASRAPEGKA